MPPDQKPSRQPAPQVTARHVLSTLSEIRRRRHWPLMQELEANEPDLCEFVLEELSGIHHALLEGGRTPKRVRQLQRRVQRLVLVCLLAPQQARRAEDDPTASSSPDAS